MFRKKSYNYHPAANAKLLDRTVWADCCWKLTVNLLINGTTGEVDRRLIRKVGRLWFEEN